MAKDFSLHFRAVAEPHLPPESRVVIPDGGPDLVMLITWRLNSDPLRPNKRSRMIRIAISHEALEDYGRGTDGGRLAGDTRFIAWLQSKLASFDPNHDAPLGVDPPPVTWTLTTLELNV